MGGVFTTRPELTGTFGMVASTHWLASGAGMAVLEGGGNAFDAAAAAAFVLHVVEPHLNGPGGEVPAIFVTGEDAEPRVLCGQGVAPWDATISRYKSLGLDLVPGTGFLAATVPGAVGAWLTLVRDYGTRSIREVLDYAIGYADGGHVPVARVLETIGAVEELFRDEWVTSAELWLPVQQPLLRNRLLGQTYRRLIAEAEAAGGDRDKQFDAAITAWYEGFVAEAIDEFCRTPVLDDSGRRHAGVLTGADLAGWRPSYERPISAPAYGWNVYKVGLWCQGAVLLQQLAMLQALGELASPGSSDLVHRVVEVAKLAFADREAWYGEGTNISHTDLLAPDYVRERASLVNEDASMELRPGSPGGRVPRLPNVHTAPVPLVQMGGLGEPTVSSHGTTGGDTCHIDVADRWGNMISATPSGGWLQSSPAIPGLGFCLGTRAQMFWLDEGLPSSLAPGRRPRSTLTPSFARTDGKMMAFGTPGGDQQDQWQLGFFLNHAAFGMDLQASIDAPAWHTTAFPSSFYPRTANPGEVIIESRLDGSELERRGHRVIVSEPWSLGRLSAVSRDDNGIMRAAANPRGMQGYAAGR